MSREAIEHDCAWSPEIDGCVVSEGGWMLDRTRGTVECAWERKADGLVFVASVASVTPGPRQTAEIHHAQMEMREYIPTVPLGGWDLSRGEGEVGQRATFDRVGPFEGTIIAVDVKAREYIVTLTVPFDWCSRNLRRAAFEQQSFDANGAPV